MASSNNLDALSQDGELPFGHPGRRSDDTPEGFDPSPLVDQGPELARTPDEDGRVGPLRPRDPPPVRLREHDRGLHRRLSPGGRLWGLPGARGGGPAGPHRLPRRLPSLLAGDHRPGRSGVASGGSEAMPALRSEGVVKMGEGWMRN